MKMKIEMAEVMKCSAEECAYNHDGGCHARAITIGDGTVPHCDTAFNCGSHCSSNNKAGVGACKVGGCMHNVDFECQAANISVGTSGGRAMCKTFQM